MGQEHQRKQDNYFEQQARAEQERQRELNASAEREANKQRQNLIAWQEQQKRDREKHLAEQRAKYDKFCTDQGAKSVWEGNTHHCKFQDYTTNITWAGRNCAGSACVNDKGEVYDANQGRYIAQTQKQTDSSKTNSRNNEDSLNDVGAGPNSASGAP